MAVQIIPVANLRYFCYVSCECYMNALLLRNLHLKTEIRGVLIIINVFFGNATYVTDLKIILHFSKNWSSNFEMCRVLLVHWCCNRVLQYQEIRKNLKMCIGLEKPIGLFQLSNGCSVYLTKFHTRKQKCSADSKFPFCWNLMYREKVAFNLNVRV